MRLSDPTVLHFNSPAELSCLSVRPSVRPVTLCVVTGPEPEPLQQPVDCHNRRPLWCLFGHLLHFDPLLSFCIGAGRGGQGQGRAGKKTWEILGYGFQDLGSQLWGLGNFRIWFSGHGFQDLGSQLWGLGNFRIWFSGLGISTLGPEKV